MTKSHKLAPYSLFSLQKLKHWLVEMDYGNPQHAVHASTFSLAGTVKISF